MSGTRPASIFAFASIDGAEAGNAGAPPPRPVFNARTAADFVGDHEALEADEAAVQRLWTSVSDGCGVLREAIARHKARAHAPGDPPAPLEVQEHIARIEAAALGVYRVLDPLARADSQLAHGRRALTTLAIDVIAHRPSQMAMLEPDAPVLVTTDTPTLGPRLTDEAMLTRDFGLNLSG